MELLIFLFFKFFSLLFPQKVLLTIKSLISFELQLMILGIIAGKFLYNYIMHKILLSASSYDKII